jgi:nucleoside 2-deoxyribosyltransferase
VYLAGPSGFTEPGRRWHAEVLRPAVEGAGFTALDPWEVGAGLFEHALTLDDGPERLAALALANREAARRNVDLIRQAAAVLALLDGVDVDSGTAAEIGYAAALRTPVVGLRTDQRVTGDNAATTVNLQVEFFLTAVCTDLESSIAELRRVAPSG